jgi:MoaA/NifB/PqqE/SkfB family radical SAM enzyme
MGKDLLEKSIQEAIRIGVKEIIPTTMGEPLLYKDFDIFINMLSKSKVKLNLTTNGTFPYIGIEKWAAKLLPILSDIKISINGIDSKINESIMMHDNTPTKLNDIIKFVKIRDKNYSDVSITLQVTFLKSNLDELENIISFAIEHNINRVKGHHLWITYDEIEDESLQNSSKKIAKWNDFIDKIDKYRDKIKLVNFEKLNSQSNTKVVALDYDCPFLGQELWIDYNGDFNICCAPSEYRKTLGCWGNIQNRTIEEVFNSKEYLELLKTYKSKDVCQKCSLRRKL